MIDKLLCNFGLIHHIFSSSSSIHEARSCMELLNEYEDLFFFHFWLISPSCFLMGLAVHCSLVQVDSLVSDILWHSLALSMGVQTIDWKKQFCRNLRFIHSSCSQGICKWLIVKDQILISLNSSQQNPQGPQHQQMHISRFYAMCFSGFFSPLICPFSPLKLEAVQFFLSEQTYKFSRE